MRDADGRTVARTHVAGIHAACVGLRGRVVDDTDLIESTADLHVQRG